jgi:hypothetical protein
VKKAMTVATIIVLYAAIIGGLEAILWCSVFAIPIGIVLGIIGHALGWFEQ